MGKCIEEECNKSPVYGLPGGKAQYCIRHKTVDMIDVRNKKCKYVDCDKQGTFSYTNNSDSYCLAHKKPDMIDTKHKLCIFTGCKTRPTYNLPGSVALYCSKLRTDSHGQYRSVLWRRAHLFHSLEP